LKGRKRAKEKEKEVMKMNKNIVHSMRNQKLFLLMLLLSIIGATIVLPNIVMAKTDSTGMGICVGAAETVITPNIQYLNGYTGIHDDLYASCVAIYDWRINTTVVLVDLDLHGQELTDITIPIRNRVEANYGINGDYVLIGSTHTHAPGVDVIGVYSGSTNPYIVNVYKPQLIDKVVEIIGLALNDMRRTVVQVGSICVSGMTFNRRYYPEVGPTDDELTAVRFIDLKGETIATLVNFASHPVITMTGTLISADFCGYLCKALEDKFGGIGIYFNGAEGNINPSMFIKYSSPFAPDDPAQYEAAEEYGENLAEYAIQALQNGKIFNNLPMEVAKTTVDLPLENPSFIYAMTRGLINRTVILTDKGYIVRTEVSGVKMGPIEMLTVPGELFSEIALFLKENMPKYGFLLGLTPEELGYIIPPEQWAPGTGEVGESMSMSVKIAPILTEALLQVITELEQN